MKIDKRIRNRAVALVKKGNAVIATYRPTPRGVIGFGTLSAQEYANWRSQSLAFLTDLLGAEHVYTNSFETRTEKSGYTESTRAGIGILQAVLEDIEQGFIDTIRQLLTAEVFTDLLDQATHLLESGYKAPAASLAGAVLEDGLRRIATRKGVSVRATDNLPSLNQKLAGVGIYSRLTQRKLHVWIEVRNNADHGHFDQINDEDVDSFIKGVGSLLSDY